MNSTDRKIIRTGLRMAGMERVCASLDHGDGRYTETFTAGPNASDVVTITWGKRTAAPAVSDPRDEHQS